MTGYASLPLEAHDNRSVFLEHAWNIGRAYRNQAMELISICRLLSLLAPPQLAHEDAELRRIRRGCDLALRSAADSGTKVTDEANARLKEATRLLSSHSHAQRGHRLDLPLTVFSRMEIAQQKDSLERDWQRATYDEGVVPTMTINFVLLRSPLLSPHDPETIVLSLDHTSEELSAGPPLAEILWNFSRYKDRGRITLEQNPHFYLRCPANEGAYTPTFRRHPLQESSGALEHNDTVYILFDRPSRVFLDTEHKSRIFGNVWLLNGSLIFRDSSGVLEGEQLVTGSSIRCKLQHSEQPLEYHDSESRPRLDHSYLRPIITTPSANPSSVGEFEDWTVLSRPASHSINVHIYRPRGSPGSTSHLNLPPPPPTSEKPEYRVLYTTVNTLGSDILLNMFNYYRRLEGGYFWNLQFMWCKLSHVCRRWRHIIYELAFHLGMHIRCTYGTPIVDTLNHLPPIPLFIDYQQAVKRGWGRMTTTGEDESGIYHALRLRDRVCSIDLCLPPSILHAALMLMDEPFPILEHLFLSSTDVKITKIALPKTFLAPKLYHLALVGIGLPKRLRLLSFTVSLVVLKLTNIRASGYFHPRLLVARLRFLPKLEALTIEFFDPIPRPRAERELLAKQGTPVTLHNLKNLTFQGISAYLESLVARIRAPLLKRLDIVLFNQIAFSLPHLSHLTNIAEGLKISTARSWATTLATTKKTGWGDDSHDTCFVLRAICKQLDWQIDCTAQICSSLAPALSGVEGLTLNFHERTMPTEWQNGEIDGTTWHELLRSFIGVKELHISESLSQELSRSLEVDDIGSDPGLLPNLQKLVVNQFTRNNTDSLFGLFIHARQVAGRPVLSAPFQLPFGA
ncbi:hypothetical protein EDB83DRAFT_2552038 [Lactarius deliciosus]|nr:hypothetical protein EDB83DRAFT_2552038 [Lactarius deliciosus]